MDAFQRIRALDAISDELEKWVAYNPLFYNSIPAFDEAFDRGVQLNLAYYVERYDNQGRAFEIILNNNLFSAHRNPTGKVYNLSGPVGSGKTSVCRYLVEKYFPEKNPTTLGIMIDVWPSEEKDDVNFKELTNSLKEALYHALTRYGVIRTYAEFYTTILKQLGFETHSVDKILRIGEQIDLFMILEFLSSYEKFNRILIIIDNIDETNRDTIENCKSFALKIAKSARAKPSKAFSILLPVREYTRTVFFSQAHFAHYDLPPLQEHKVIAKKLEQKYRYYKRKL
nr:AAA family ATPase [Desulfobacula sp.]